MPASETLDRACAEAVELARTAAVNRAGVMGVGEHRGVFAEDTPVPIGPTEYRLLHFFMTHPERVYTRAQLLDHVWGGSVYVEERTVDVHIRRLRKSLNEFGPDYIRTVRATGYAIDNSLGEEDAVFKAVLPPFKRLIATPEQ